VDDIGYDKLISDSIVKNRNPKQNRFENSTKKHI